MPNMYNSVSTWNPFVGCNFGCTYCKKSFHRVVKRIAYCQHYNCHCLDFQPHEHPERLQGPLPRASILWPCAHGDITFAKPDYIQRIIARVNQDAGRYKEIYWQSKNPSCLAQYISKFPENSVLLTTLETNRDAGYESVSSAPPPSVRAIALAALPWPRKMVTIEPVMDFDHEIFVEWIEMIHPMAIWIGYNSKGSGLPEPGLSKVKGFIKDLESRGYEVRQKKIRAAFPCSSQREAGQDAQ